MAANDHIIGIVQTVAEDSQSGQQLIVGGLSTEILDDTATPYVMAPIGYKFFAPPTGTQVFGAAERVVPPQGFLLVKVRANTASKAFDSIGSTSGALRLSVLEQDLTNLKKDPVTRTLTEVDRNTTRVPDDLTWSSSTAVYNEAYAFQPGNGRAWIQSGPFAADFRTTA